MTSKEPTTTFEPEKPIVPDGWDVLPFQKAATVISDQGKRVKQSTYSATGKIPVVDQGQDYIGGYIDDDAMAYDGELPVILFGDHTRSIKYIDKRFAVGAEGIKILRPADGYNPKFFYYLLRSLQIPSRGYSRHFQFLKQFHLPIAPPNEQKLIVAEIEKQFSRLDEAVANLKRVKANIKRYKAAVLNAACMGQIGSANRQAWTSTTLGAVAKQIRNGYSLKPDAEQGTRIFRISSVRPLTLVLDDVRYLSGKISDYADFQVMPGDILFTRYNGNPDFVGVCAVVPDRCPPTIHPDKLISVKVPDTVLIPQMLAILASAGESRAFLKQRIRTTAGQAGISGTDLKSLPLSVPPIAEQHRIVAEVDRLLSTTTEIEAQVTVNLIRAERLRQSILKKAFAGMLIDTAQGQIVHAVRQFAC
jgi:type I restriction enzyme S subunit